MRLTQHILEEMIEDERVALVGKTARDKSYMNFGVVVISGIKKNRTYEITFATEKGSKYTYLGELTQFLELI